MIVKYLDKSFIFPRSVISWIAQGSQQDENGWTLRSIEPHHVIFEIYNFL